ncbi:MAG TPA: hypothetical protein VFQ38_12200 [Longimicrobiales bacterium]|nr:hypothetical protein [Longimicrobiales bacterium]
MPAGPPICIATANFDIAEMLTDFLEPHGWTVYRLTGADLADPALTDRCGLMLCDVDLPPFRVAAVGALGRPVVYFSSSRQRQEVVVPPDGVAFLQLPIAWPALEALLRSLGTTPQ